MLMNDKIKIVVLAAGVVLVFVGAVWYTKYYRSTSSADTEENLGYKSDFLPSQQGLYFQGMPPSLKVENDYHSQMLAPKEIGGCEGDYGNFECAQKSYLKAMKAGTTDKADLICHNYNPDAGGDEDSFYKCLDSVYGNNRWMDRSVGTDSCMCQNDDGTTEVGTLTDFGTSTTTSSSTGGAGVGCFCPKARPLHDRRPVDINHNLIDRVY
jgi:hypothetical protein